MIVDTSALVAILYEEVHAEILAAAIFDEAALIPAPVILEFCRVAERQDPALGEGARSLIEAFVSGGATIIPFSHDHAKIAADANKPHGQGMRHGGKLNMLDLMVYAVARERDQAILCTGSDFARSDAEIHPASRGW